MTEPEDGACQLYRHWAEDGTLLYVGVSLSTVQRLSQHKNRSPWFGDISKITVEVFPSRKEALRAEKDAIQSESPLHNKALANRQCIVKREIDHCYDELLDRTTYFKPLYTVSEVAGICGLPVEDVTWLIEEGELGHIYLGDVLSRRDEDDLIRVTGWQLIDLLGFLEHETWRSVKSYSWGEDSYRLHCDRDPRFDPLPEVGDE